VIIHYSVQPAEQPADYQIERINFDDGYIYRLYDQSYDVTFVTGTLKAVRDYYSVRHENDLEWKAPSLKAFIVDREKVEFKTGSIPANYQITPFTHSSTSPMSMDYLAFKNGTSTYEDFLALKKEYYR